jgi:hypothetical protein
VNWRVFDWWPDLSVSLILRLTTLYNFTITHTGLSRHVLTSRCSVSAFDGWRSPFSGFPNCPRASATSSSQPLNLSVSLTHWLTNSVTHQPANSIDSITFLLTTSRHRAYRKHRSITPAQLSWKHACLRIRYLPTAVMPVFLSRSLPSNWSICHNSNVFA